jgi:DNA-binding transcriptional ArsR family regulator
MANQKDAQVLLSRENNEVLLDYTELRKAVMVLRAVNHKLRQDIVELLSEISEKDKGMTVTDIYIRLRIEQSVASQHLAILRKANIVITERNGKYIYYSLNPERLSQISGLVEELAK